ncbi:glycoside hydrolase family 15 protein [Metabacillus arenae]|uniref:Glycoside hydrolase family 15 n=1 Tax=Metabacillus arenae TaxID=2771434 RepID=A0A926NJQ8_9BACI|nr:glycoside hydrolase family 15 protein [Metabacillus arenae]MBD1379116.1 glycoside hydrolase family 15 [Metabacillus arenae]
MNKLEQSYNILESLRLPHGLYYASPSSDYSYVWIRDSCYEVMPYLDKQCNRYEKTYHRLLDLFLEYEWKIEIHTKQKPHAQWEYIHARFSAQDVKEIDTPWGHAQHDAVGAFLFGVGEGVKKGKKIIRNEADHRIIQKLVWYLDTCQYWIDSDNGMWEEWREVHSSSVGACIAGLQNVREIVFVPRELVLKGYYSLSNLFPNESADRPIDLAQMSLIYPYKVLFSDDAVKIVNEVESKLLRSRGVIRYQGDSYYSTIEHEGRHHPLSHYYGTEAEWCFGLPWLALCHMELGNYNKAKDYIEWTESVMLEDGSLPELYLSGTNQYNINTPLGWSNAMYIQAKEKYINKTVDKNKLINVI